MEGHKKQIEFFRNAIASGRLSHAYILSGMEGSGKKLFAIKTAKTLVCEKGSFFSECDCPQCKAIDMGAHPDFRIFSPEELTVENMRSVCESASMTPLSSKWKIYILDGAEVFSASQNIAGNALLKTLEEPGSNSIFFLITSRYSLVMPTIRSRASLVKFGGLSAEEVKNALKTLRPEEKFLDRAALKSGGSVSKALRILDGNALASADFLEAGEYKRFASAILSLKDKEEIRLAAEFVYVKALEDFKRSGGEYKFYLLGEYMLEILKRLTYNVNADLLKADFLIKTIEVSD